MENDCTNKQITSHINCMNKCKESFQNVDKNDATDVIYFPNKCSDKSIIEKIMELFNERQKLISKINILQQKLAMFIAGSSQKEYFRKLNYKECADESTFRNLLDIITNKVDELENISNQNSSIKESLQKEIDVKKDVLAEQKMLFKELIEKTALHSVNSKTGERFTVQEVKELLRKQEEAFKAVEECQLYSIQKRHTLNLAIEKKTNLAEGPLDFAEYEMMNIEIQNNKEIIQPLSEEIQNIRKKVSNIINILSHLEQKLYLAQKEKSKAQITERLLENELQQMRSQLSEEKIKYNQMKLENNELQHKFILLQYPHLIEDYNTIHKENTEGQNELEKLKKTYEEEIKLIKNSL